MQRLQIAQNALVSSYYLFLVEEELNKGKLKVNEDNLLLRMEKEARPNLGKLSKDEFQQQKKRWILAKQDWPLWFWVKPFFHLWQAPVVIKHLLPCWQNEFKTDGQVLTPNEESASKGFCPRLFKFKRGTDNTIDFELVWVTRDEFRAMIEEKNLMACPVNAALYERLKNRTRIACMYTYEFVDDSTRAKCFTALDCELESLTLAEYKQAKFLQQPLLETHERIKRQGKCFALKLGSGELLTPLDSRLMSGKQIYECRYFPENKEWVIQCLREGRNSANAWPTVKKTLDNISQNLTDLDVFPFIGSQLAQKDNFSFNAKPCLTIRDPHLIRSMYPQLSKLAKQ